MTSYERGVLQLGLADKYTFTPTDWLVLHAGTASDTRLRMAITRSATYLST